MFNFIFRPNKEGFSKVFGELEAQVMEVMWRLGEASVREVFKELDQQRELAYTTVLSTMRNLERKGYLERNKSDVTHVYKPTCTEEELSRRVVDEVVDGLLDGFAEPFLARLANINRKDLAGTVERVEKLLDNHDKGGKTR